VTSAGTLAGKSILIIGASSGLGRAIAEAAAPQGANLTLAARRMARLADIQSGLDSASRIVECDVAAPGDCDRAVACAVDQFGGLDVLVYSAGCSPLGPLAEMSLDEWRRIFEVNTIGAAMALAAGAPYLRAKAWAGAVHFICGSARAQTGVGTIAASKRALEAVVSGLRLEEPDIAFTTMVVASTGDTEFSSEWDAELRAHYTELWQGRGLLTRGSFGSEVAFAELVTNVIAAQIAVPEIFFGPLPFETVSPLAE
jgi:NAD(P)-dependent dehydrogenase (short-subunit alcohol dehydrogenase family)